MFYNNNVKGYGKGYVGRKSCRRMTAERPPKDRRQGSLAFELKISNLPSCMTRTRNALVFRRYVIAT